VVLNNPAASVKGRLNSLNFAKPSTVEWLRPRIDFSDLDLTVNQDNWHTFIEGKDFSDFHRIASISDYWGAYHLCKERLSIGQIKTCNAQASMGAISIVVLHHSRLRRDFTGPSTKYNEDKTRRVFVGATGPLMASESELAHPYVHTPLLIRCQFYSKRLCREVIDYLESSALVGFEGHKIYACEWAGHDCEKVFYVRLPLPVGDLSIAEIDNDEIATIVCANTNTHLAKKYGRLTPQRLLDEFSDKAVTTSDPFDL
jgi:hypothetical protein